MPDFIPERADTDAQPSHAQQERQGKAIARFDRLLTDGLPGREWPHQEMPYDHTESRQHDDKHGDAYPEGQRAVAGWHAAPGTEHDEHTQNYGTQQPQPKPVPARHDDGIAGHRMLTHGPISSS